MRNLFFACFALLLGACGDDDDTPPVGSERGPCGAGGACNAGLVCLSEVCVRPLDASVADAGDDEPDAAAPLADAAPRPDVVPVVDGGIAGREYFEAHVAAILAERCASCHGAPGSGAPVFGSTYASHALYEGTRGKLIDCTLTQSLLFTKGAHAGPAFSAGEEAHVRTFLDLDALDQAGCAITAGRRPSTGSLPLMVDDYVLDLSVLGQGIGNSRITFSVTSVLGGLEISAFTAHAGDNGLVLVGPGFEVCREGTADPVEELLAVRLTLAPNTSASIGDGFFAIPDVLEGAPFGLRFAALLPASMRPGFPQDAHGACVPTP